MPSSNSLKPTLESILAELSAVFARLDDATVAGLAEAILSSDTVFVAGAGRSGMLLRCFAMRLMHLGKKVYMVGEVVTPAIRAGDLLFIASGSGETASLASMARKAKSIGAKLALVTANPASTIAGLADVTVHIPALTPKAEVSGIVESRQPMGNLFEQSMLLLLEAIVMELMARTGKTSEEMFRVHANLE